MKHYSTGAYPEDCNSFKSVLERENEAERLKQYKEKEAYKEKVSPYWIVPIVAIIITLLLCII